MKWVMSALNIIAPILLLLSIFLIFSREIPENDMWFHLKSGEIISQNGIIYKDLISQAGPERTWYPYEWSFQLGIYLLHRVFGLTAIFAASGFFAAIQSLLVYLFVNRFFKLKWYWSLLITISYVLLSGGFFTPRPQIVSKVLFMGVLFLVHLYASKGKNYLVVTLPLIYFWSTFHASLFLGPATFFLYFGSCMIAYFFTKNSLWLKRSRTLLITGIMATFVSILPPTGLLQYQYMLYYVANRQTYLSIHEGLPLYYFLPDLLFYLAHIFIVIIPLLIISKSEWTKHKETFFLFFPFFFYIMFGFIALRSTEYGLLVIPLIGAWILTNLNKQKLSQTCAALVMIVILLVQLGGLISQYQQALHRLPTQAADFLKKSSLSGNYFNLYQFGGYFGYQLSPRMKPFIDGRTDVFVCCELPAYMALQKKSTLQDGEFSTELLTFFETYKIKTVVLRYRDTPFGNKILSVLKNNPEWNLLFWDDYDVILANEPATQTATPFSPLPFQNDQKNDALEKYLQMDNSYPSALSKNNIGFIYTTLGNKTVAQKYFLDAITKDPSFHFAYFNLSAIKIQEGNKDEARTLLKKAIKYSQGREREVYQNRLNAL